MANNIVQLIDKDNNNIFPVAGSMAGDSVTTSMIQDNAVTSAKIKTEVLDLTSLTLAGGYNWGADARIIKVGDFVYFEGGLQVPAITTTNNGTTAFNLPEGWRTVSNGLNFITYNNAPTFARIRIAPNGDVQISKMTNDLSANSYVQLTGVLFRTS